MTSQSDADAEAARQFALIGEKRRIFSVSVAGMNDQFEIGKTITVEISRGELTDGKDFIIIGRNEQYSKNITILKLWG